MSLNVQSYEELVKCPYNPLHMVVKHRLPKHLIKCRLSHSSAGFKECKFNLTHVYRKNEIANHEATCPDRLNLELSMMQHEEFQPKASSSAISINPRQNIKTNDEEDWDLSPPHPTYDPLAKCASSDVIINIKGGLPSERQARRKQERERLNNIRN